MMKIGIEAIHFDIPKIYLPIKDLAHARGIEPEKLQLGLGLEKMSFPDLQQDAVVFGANALKKLIETEKLQPEDIARIYVGTESAVDGSKPIASYLIHLMEETLFKAGSLSHVDVVDLTFACIGGVDAIQNCVDFIKAYPTQKAIVICTDIAKYDWASSGEYTQGAGAIALLISANPSILAFDEEFAVSTESVFDFFKPRRNFSKKELNISEDLFEVLESEIDIYKEQPVFEGQYSNQCYINRTTEAYFRLKKLQQKEGSLFEDWKTICMHLPYCFQARRVFTEIFIADSEWAKEKEKTTDVKEFLKSVSKSESYQKLVQEKIYPTEVASAQIGNMYTASIFMGFLSALSYYFEQNEDLIAQKIGFIAYGSGSKSKAFSGTIQPQWKEKIQSVKLFETLQSAKNITIEEYEQLHKKQIHQSIQMPSKEFVLDSIESENPHLLGARYYKWKE